MPCLHDLHSIPQDVPFLILAGTYANGSGVLNVPIFFSLVVSLVGMVSYVFYLVVERHNIQARRGQGLITSNAGVEINN